MSDEFQEVDSLLERWRPVLYKRNANIDRMNELADEYGRLKEIEGDLEEEMEERGRSVAAAVIGAMKSSDPTVVESVRHLYDGIRDHWPEWFESVEDESEAPETTDSATSVRPQRRAIRRADGTVARPPARPQRPADKEQPEGDQLP